MRTPKRLIWPVTLRLTKVNRYFFEGTLYQVVGPIDDLISFGLIALDTKNKLIGGPGVRNIVVRSDQQICIEILARYLINHDKHFLEFLQKLSLAGSKGETA